MKENYTFRAEAILEKLTEQTRLIYIDNPNNPTGQLIPLSEIETVAAAARALDVALLIDEAYGDYVPCDTPAATLLDRYDNVIVTRTFSKAFGLAGLRMGYLLAVPTVVRELKKLTTPYDGNAIARQVCASVLEDADFLPQLRGTVQCIKQVILQEPFSNLKIACTDPRVPIMMIVHPKQDVNLAAALADHGVAVVSGSGFYHM